MRAILTELTLDLQDGLRNLPAIKDMVHSAAPPNRSVRHPVAARTQNQSVAAFELDFECDSMGFAATGKSADFHCIATQHALES